VSTSILRLGLALVATIPAAAHAVGVPAPGALGATSVKLPGGPGSVRGLADRPTVDTFGAQVQYRVGLEVPAAAAGFRPELALVYDGALGQGPLGHGWRLELPEIRRSLRLGVPRFDGSDELELTGLADLGSGRLVRLADGSFRVEGLGHAVRVEALGAGFRVVDPRGTRYTFGVSPGARQGAGDRVVTWHLERIENLAGESVDLTYAADQGQVYLGAVSYGPATPDGRAFRVDLDYTARPDTVVSYRTGARVVTARRLTAVRVHAFGELLRKYALGYDDGFALSRLSRVELFGRSGASGYPALTFTYASRGEAAIVPLTTPDGWTLGDDTSLVDVDGDALADLVRLSPFLGNAVEYNRGGSFEDPVPLPGADGLSLHSARLVDVDGDTRPELAYVLEDRWQVAPMVTGGFGAPTEWPGSDFVPLFAPHGDHLDVNGDGRLDVLMPGMGGASIIFGGPGGFDGPAKFIDGVPTGIVPGTPEVRFPDLNGDGLDDAVVLRRDGYTAYHGTGDGDFVLAHDADFPWVGAALPADVFIVDLDRDGLADLIHAAGASVDWYAGRALGGFAEAPSSLGRPPGDDALARVSIADVNGNGSFDVVWSSEAGMWVLDLAGPTTAGMLVAIDNGLGLETRFTYEASTALARAAAAIAPWTRQLPMSVPVPVAMEEHGLAGGPIRRTEYGVRDGLWDALERRFAGFRVGVVRERGESAAATRVTTTEYHEGTGDDRVLRGRPRRVTVTSGIDEVLTITEHTWAARPVAGLTGSPLLRKAALVSVRTTSHQGVDTPIATLTTTSFDDEVRAIETHDHGRLDQVGDERIVRTTWASDPLTGVRDVAIETQTLAGDGVTVLAHERTLYGDDLVQLPFGQVGKGWPREVQAWLAYGDTARWVTTGRRTYAMNGQLTSELKDGVTRTFTHDAVGLHTVSETVHVTPGRSLTFTATWDRVLGAPVTNTTPAGETTVATYDAFGRVTSVGLAGRPAHTVYRYDLSAPVSTVTTHVFDGALAALTAFTAFTPGGGWRESRTVTNGAGEQLYEAVRTGDAGWIVQGMRRRDRRGRVVAVAEPFAASSLAGLTAAPAGTAEQLLTYDAFDRRLSQFLPTGGLRRTDYAAFREVEHRTDEASVERRYDGLGRTVHTRRQVDETLETADASYDAAGRLLALSLQGGRVSHRFTYDTLGRLRRGEDPDVGVRTYAYDDAGRVIARSNGVGETVTTSYDGAGRPVETRDHAGRRYVYHYDVARVAGVAGTAGRLAWVEEPSGTVDLGYDEQGRQRWMRREIRGRAGEKTVTLSPSGLVLSIAHDTDGFAVDTQYDDAGRAIRVGDLWWALRLDPAGRVLEERYGNGVAQVTARDLAGQSTRIRVSEPAGTALYDVHLARNPMGRLAGVTDVDGVGLDHSATFTFDLASRLTAATTGPFAFTYAYDALQNMTTRSASGPRAVNVLTGTYSYGAATPRRLASVTAADGVVTTFAHDAAGRLVTEGARAFAYDGFDQLVAVTEAGVGVAEHAYGYDGQRVWTRSAAGEQRWFTDDLVERDGVRQHYVRLAGRTIARVDTVAPTLPVAVAPLAPAPGLLGAWRWVVLGILGAGLLVTARAVVRASARPRWVPTRAGLTLVAFVGSCAGDHRPDVAAGRSAATALKVVYFHQGPAAGPVLLTGPDAGVLDERRFEPFGEPIDAALTVDPVNSLNKETDLATGLSYHGARWMNPRTARWTVADPPTKAPDATFMLAPWQLNPYAYVDQNPVAFWDPDGREPAPSGVRDHGPGTTRAQASAPPIGAVAVAAATPRPSPVAAATSTKPSQPVDLGDIDAVDLGDIDAVDLGDIDAVDLGDIDAVDLGDIDAPASPARSGGGMAFGWSAGWECGLGRGLGVSGGYGLFVNFDKRTVQLYSTLEWTNGFDGGGVMGASAGYGRTFASYGNAADFEGDGASLAASFAPLPTGELTLSADGSRVTGSSITIGPSVGTSVHAMHSRTHLFGPAIPYAAPRSAPSSP
jgi:RHS repeat-associated protein